MKSSKKIKHGNKGLKISLILFFVGLLTLTLPFILCNEPSYYRSVLNDMTTANIKVMSGEWNIDYGSKENMDANYLKDAREKFNSLNSAKFFMCVTKHGEQGQYVEETWIVKLDPSFGEYQVDYSPISNYKKESSYYAPLTMLSVYRKIGNTVKLITSISGGVILGSSVIIFIISKIKNKKQTIDETVN